MTAFFRLKGRNFSMQPEKVRTRKKRSQIQQSIISVVCLAFMVFVFAWLINTAVTGKKNGLIPTFGTASAEKKNKTVSKPDELKPDKPKKDESSSASDTSSADDSSTADDTLPYEGAAMKDDFSDACFIGDSRTVGLEMNSDKAKADFFASQGLSIDKVDTELVVELDDGSLGTIADGVAQRQYGRIFIMFGINELGWPYPENFVDKYVDLINTIKELQPNAAIYIESVLPVSPEAAQTNEVFTNDNIDNFNTYVKQAADKTGTIYLDVNSYFKDETGALPEDAAADGIHFVRDYCLKWIDLLAYLAPQLGGSADTSANG